MAAALQSDAADEELATSRGRPNPREAQPEALTLGPEPRREYADGRRRPKSKAQGRGRRKQAPNQEGPAESLNSNPEATETPVLQDLPRPLRLRSARGASTPLQPNLRLSQRTCRSKRHVAIKSSTSNVMNFVQGSDTSTYAGMLWTFKELKASLPAYPDPTLAHAYHDSYSSYSLKLPQIRGHRCQGSIGLGHVLIYSCGRFDGRTTRVRCVFVASLSTFTTNTWHDRCIICSTLV